MSRATRKHLWHPKQLEALLTREKGGNEIEIAKKKKQYTVVSKCPSEASKAAGNVANLDCSGEIWEGNTQQSTMLPTERGDSSVRLQFFQRRSLAAVISCINAWKVLVFNPIMERTNCHKRLMYHSSAVAADHFCKNNMRTQDQLAMHLMNHLRKELKGLKQKKF